MAGYPFVLAPPRQLLAVQGLYVLPRVLDLGFPASHFSNLVSSILAVPVGHSIRIGPMRPPFRHTRVNRRLEGLADQSGHPPRGMLLITAEKWDLPVEPPGVRHDAITSSSGST